MSRRIVIPAAVAAALAGGAVLIASQVPADAQPATVEPQPVPAVTPTALAARQAPASGSEIKAPIVRGTIVEVREPAIDPVAENTTVPVAQDAKATQVRPTITIERKGDTAVVTITHRADAVEAQIAHGWGASSRLDTYPLAGDPARIVVDDAILPGVHITLHNAEGAVVSSHSSLVQPDQQRIRTPRVSLDATCAIPDEGAKVTTTIGNLHTEKFGGRLLLIPAGANDTDLASEWTVPAGTTMQRFVQVPAGRYTVHVESGPAVDANGVPGDDNVPTIIEEWQLDVPSCR